MENGNAFVVLNVLSLALQKIVGINIVLVVSICEYCRNLSETRQSAEHLGNRSGRREVTEKQVQLRGFCIRYQLLGEERVRVVV